MDHQLVELASRVSSGRILTPTEMRAECESLVERPHLSGYALAGTVTAAEADIVDDETVPHAMCFPVYYLPCGLVAGVPTLQAGPLQLRTLIPLVGEAARAWLRWSAKERTLAYWLDIAGGKQVTWHRFPFTFAGAAALNTHLDGIGQLDMSRAAVELAALNARLAFDDAIPSSFSAIAVNRVRVVNVLDEMFGVTSASPGQSVH